MRLTCPNCSTQYEVADAAIPAEGRDVQCGACQKVWFQTPAAGIAAAGAAASAAASDAVAAPPAPAAAPPAEPTTAPAPAPAPAPAAEAKAEATSEFQEPEPANVKPDIAATPSPDLSPGLSGQPPKTEASDAFAAISRRIAREAEAMEHVGETPRTSKPEDVAAPPSSERPAFEEPKAVTEPLTEPERPAVEAPRAEAPDTDAPITDVPEAPTPSAPAPAPGPAEPSEAEVAAALAEITRPDAPRPSAAITPDTSDIAEMLPDVETPADTASDDADRSGGRGFLTAVSAAAAGVATARAGESDEAGIAEQIKRRVKEAVDAGPSDESADDPKEQQVFGASAEAVAEAAAEEVDDRLPDADSLASSLRSDIAGAKEEGAAARGSGFWGGFGAAVGVAACAAVIYLAAPTIGRMAPPLQPMLDSYVGQINGVREMIGG